MYLSPNICATKPEVGGTVASQSNPVAKEKA